MEKRKTDSCEQERIEDWIAAYQMNHSEELIEKIVQRATPLVTRLVYQYMNVGVERDDLVQVGMVALLLAIQRFDPALGYTFATYAIPTIEGEMKRYLRDKTWLLHVPRKTKELSQRMRTLVVQMAAEEEEYPTVEELARMLQVSEEEIVHSFSASQNYHPLSIDRIQQLPHDQMVTLLDCLGEEDLGFDEVENRLFLQKALPALSAEEQAVLHGIFFRRWSQKKVGEQLGLSQMQVSRIQRRALTKLQEMVKTFYST